MGNDNEFLNLLFFGGGGLVLMFYSKVYKKFFQKHNNSTKIKMPTFFVWVFLIAWLVLAGLGLFKLFQLDFYKGVILLFVSFIIGLIVYVFDKD